METLLEDYRRRLKTVMNEIKKGGNDLILNRLGTKASCYRTFISELEYARHQAQQEREQPDEPEQPDNEPDRVEDDR